MVEHKHKDHLKYVRGFSSRANHIGQAPDPATGAVIRPLYLSSTYILDDNFKTPVGNISIYIHIMLARIFLLSTGSPKQESV